MKTYSILVKLDKVTEILLTKAIIPCITQQGVLNAITKENDENVFCVEFSIKETSIFRDEKMITDIFALLQHMVVGL